MKITRKCLAMLLSLCLLLGLVACQIKPDAPTGDTGDTAEKNEIRDLLINSLAEYQVVRSAGMAQNEVDMLASFIEVVNTHTGTKLSMVSDFVLAYPVKDTELVVGTTTRDEGDVQGGDLSLDAGKFDVSVQNKRVVLRYADGVALKDGLEALLLQLLTDQDAATLKNDYSRALLKRGIDRYEGFWLNNQFSNGMKLLAEEFPCFGQGQVGLEVALKLYLGGSLLSEQKTEVAENGTWIIQVAPDAKADKLEITYGGVVAKSYTDVAFVDRVFKAPTDGTKIYIDGEEVSVVESDAGLQVIASQKNAQQTSMRVEIVRPDNVSKCYIRPLKSGVEPTVEGKKVSFTVDTFPSKLSVEFDIDGEENILFFFYTPETQTFPVADPNFLYFAPGDYYYESNIRLESDQTAYLAEGVHLKARFEAKGQENVSIRGRGVIDTFGYSVETRLLDFEQCKNVTLADYTLIGPRKWMTVFVDCDNCTVTGTNVIGTEMNSDGVDIVGSRNVTIDGCFFRTNDDCIAVKSWGPEVRTVRVKNSVFWDMKYGNALEIGYESRTENITDIIFENNDILHVGTGAALSIHLADRATVSNVIYRDIRIEEIYGKIIQFFIKTTNYSVDAERGHIANITFENIQLVGSTLGVIDIKGYDKTHLIQNVTINGLTFKGTPIAADDSIFNIGNYTKNIKYDGTLMSKS